MTTPGRKVQSTPLPAAAADGVGVADCTGADDLVVVGVFDVDGTAAAEFVVLGVGVDDADGSAAAEFVVLLLGVGVDDDDGTAAAEFVVLDVGVGEDVDVSEDDEINADVDDAEGSAGTGVFEEEEDGCGKGVAVSDTVGEADAPAPDGVFDGVSLAVIVEVGEGVLVATLDAVVLGVEVFEAVCDAVIVEVGEGVEVRVPLMVVVGVRVRERRSVGALRPFQ